MSFKLIAVTGTPGTGKTTTARKLAVLLHYAYLHGSKIAKKASTGYDKARKTLIVEPSLFTHEALKLKDLAARKGLKGAILDSHLAHLLPKSELSACIVLTCALPELHRRLTKRGYSAAKIRENLDAEIFDTILTEAAEMGHKVIRIDATKITQAGIKKLAARIRKL